MNAILFDIDGVLACNQHRIHYLHAVPPDWDAYYAAMDEDPLINHHWVAIARACQTLNTMQVILISNRPEPMRERTERWLIKHEVPYDSLLLRSGNITKRDHVRELKAGGYNMVMALDDNPEEWAMYAEEGIFCVQIESGYYQGQIITDPTPC